jgi:hypothetical protein
MSFGSLLALAHGVGVCRVARRLRRGWSLFRQAIESPRHSLPEQRLGTPGRSSIPKPFAKLKALLRRLAARSLDRLWSSLGRFIDLFTPQECANYFAAAGYDAI